MACGENSYRVYYFNWTEIRPGGRPGHGQQHLIWMGPGQVYAGHYEIEDPPLKVASNEIIFADHNKGDLRCEEKSELDIVWQDGSDEALTK